MRHAGVTALRCAMKSTGRYSPRLTADWSFQIGVATHNKEATIWLTGSRFSSASTSSPKKESALTF